MASAIRKITSVSADETRRLGSEVAKKALSERKMGPGALVFALKGKLGAGKTTFVQGFFKGLGIKKRAPSPTFIIMRRHRVPGGRFKDIFHVDAYRLKGVEQLNALGFGEILADPKNIILIEWPERVAGIIPRAAIRLAFSHGKKENERTVAIRK